MLPGISGDMDWWIGLSDTGHEGHWLWVGESVFCFVLHIRPTHDKEPMIDTKITYMGN